MKNTIENIAAELKVNGFATYKASTVLNSHSGWFKDSKELVFAPSLDELLYDLDSLQMNIDYDADLKASKELLNQFKAFKGAF